MSSIQFDSYFVRLIAISAFQMYLRVVCSFVTTVALVQNQRLRVKFD